MPNVVDLIYAAATIDCEGCIHINKNQQKRETAYNLVVAVQMTDSRICSWLNDTFGGTIHRHHKANPKHKPVYQWRVYCTQAIVFLVQIFPYLKIKKLQASLGIEYQKKVAVGKGRKLTTEQRELGRISYHKMKLLNKGNYDTS